MVLEEVDEEWREGVRAKSYPRPPPVYVYPPSGEEVVTTLPSNCSV